MAQFDRPDANSTASTSGSSQPLDAPTAQRLTELDDVLRRNPSNLQALAEYGQLALRTGQLKKAQHMYQALLLSPLEADSPLTEAQLFSQLAEIHIRLNENRKAIRMLEHAASVDPTFEPARERLQQLGK